MSRRRLAVLFALPLLLSPIACGSDDDEPEASTSVSGNGDPATDDTATEDTATDDTATGETADGGEDTGDVDTVDDQQRVDIALEGLLAELTAAGFAPDPDDDDDDSSFEFTSEDCQRFQEVFSEEDLPGESATAESGEYTRGEFGPNSASETLEVNVGLVFDPADLDETFAAIGDERFSSCMEEALHTEFAKQSEEAVAAGRPALTVQELSVVPLPPSGIGDGTAGVRVDSVIETAGFRIPFVLEVEFARLGRAAAMVLAGVIGAEELGVNRVGLLTAAINAVTA